MKRCISVCALTLLFGFTTASAVGQQKGDRARFVGAWKLLALERPDSGGHMTRVDCRGMFVFTRDGQLSVQVMERDANAQSAPPGAAQYAQGGYEASYGSYLVDEKEHTFTFHVEGALVRTLIGKDLPRRYEFRGNQLIVQSTHADEHWRVTWVRY